jgi:hypothetical protein
LSRTRAAWRFNQAMTPSGSFDRFDYVFNVAHFHYPNQPV